MRYRHANGEFSKPCYLPDFDLEMVMENFGYVLVHVWEEPPLEILLYFRDETDTSSRKWNWEVEYKDYLVILYLGHASEAYGADDMLEVMRVLQEPLRLMQPLQDLNNRSISVSNLISATS